MTDTLIQLSEDEFDARYELRKNHLNPTANWACGEGPGCLFEPYGEELAFVRSQDLRTVWTLIDGDDGDQRVVSGLHVVNRIGYLISTEPVPAATAIEVRIPMELDDGREAAETEALEQGVVRELLEALEDLLGDLPSVQGGVCRHCGREYHDILRGDCPSDDCPSFKARAAIAQAKEKKASSVREVDIRGLLARRGQIALLWSVEDVQRERPDLSRKQAWELLEEVQDRHDAMLGVSWTTLQVMAEDLFGPAPETVA